ncbi:MAG: hypothetical protein M3R13_03210 [Armatimonadota bacterium]|nr:hypothetical protein [Armatimonadota bacterium]
MVVSALLKTTVLVAMIGVPLDDKSQWLRRITVLRFINTFAFATGLLSFVYEKNEIAIAFFFASVIASVTIVYMSILHRRVG